jgi:molecular chaperone HscB
MDQLQQILKQDYFSILGYTIPTFEVDLVQLKSRLHELQKTYHPDNYITKGEAIRSLSLQVSAHINSAYDTLSSPLKRAIELLKLHGIKVDLAHDIQLPAEFLMLQMEMHEELLDAETERDIDRLDALMLRVRSYEEALINKIHSMFQQQTNLNNIVPLVKELAFFKQVQKKIRDTLERLW